ncbi:enoyl-CoA hydratase [Anaerobacillus sp. MEB173]|uniref:enoyl-CoA hydratase n=1 Tax=Anaerobacillus sp. MEB173 TaxID=3383345 RepID=UPI003F8F8F44
MDTKVLQFKHITLEVETPIAYVTMNRPNKRNALSQEHMEELTECFFTIGKSKEISVVILRGNGPAFCAGHDLKEMLNETPVFYQQLFDTCIKMMETIQSIPQPVIAQVHGIATAAGCQLVATCDLAIASEESTFATPGVKIGLFCSTPMVALSRAVGRKKAMEMLLTGDSLSAEDAVAAGLINKAVPANQLEEETKLLATKISQASSYTVGVGKQSFYQQIEMQQNLAYAYTKQVMSMNAAAVDASEGMCAFIEKRKPEWKGC